MNNSLNISELNNSKISPSQLQDEIIYLEKYIQQQNIFDYKLNTLREIVAQQQNQFIQASSTLNGPDLVNRFNILAQNYQNSQNKQLLINKLSQANLSLEDSDLLPELE